MDLQLFVQGSMTSGGSYFTFAVMSRKEYKSNTGMGSSTDEYIWATGEDQKAPSFIPCVYPFIKILNKSGEFFGDSDDIRIIGK